MFKTETGRTAFDHFDKGFHCAEAVSKTITDAFAPEPSRDIPSVASFFCRGVGLTGEEACGAFTGGVIAFGYLFGRNEPGGDLSKAMGLVVEFRNRFVAKFGNTRCKDILNDLGEQENSSKCKALTADTAGLLAELLVERGVEPRGSR
ncbi:C-GCAxxG-C-C family protein [Thermodesulfobacteriota bacterium]